MKKKPTLLVKNAINQLPLTKEIKNLQWKEQEVVTEILKCIHHRLENIVHDWAIPTLVEGEGGMVGGTSETMAPPLEGAAIINCQLKKKIGKQLS